MDMVPYDSYVVGVTFAVILLQPDCLRFQAMNESKVANNERRICGACRVAKPALAFGAAEWSKPLDCHRICSACQQAQHYQYCVR